MNINLEKLKELEKLAKLKVDPKETNKNINKIDNILDLLNKMDTNKISNIEPLYHPLEINQKMREDTPTKYSNRDNLQENAPQVENGLFLVPKVIK